MSWAHRSLPCSTQRRATDVAGYEPEGLKFASQKWSSSPTQRPAPRAWPGSAEVGAGPWRPSQSGVEGHGMCPIGARRNFDLS